MSGKTLALVGAGVVVVGTVIGSFALLQEDGNRPRPNTPPRVGPTNPTPNVPPAPVGVKVTPGPGLPAPVTPPPPPRPNQANLPKGTQNNPPPPKPPLGIPVAPVGPKQRVLPGPGGGPVIVVRGPDNQPVVGAVVEASTKRGALNPRPTNKDGEAALDPVPAADGKLTGTARHPRFTEGATFSCEPGAKRVEVRFAASVTGTLVGFIHDARGQAPQAAELTVIDSNGGETVLPSAGFAAWDGAGHFKVELAPGTYSVKAAAPGYCASELAYPNVAAGQENGGVDLLLEQAAAILGKVNLPPDLQVQRDPVSLTFDIEWIRGDMQNPTTTIDHRVIQLAGDGGYVLENLQSGMYRVRAGDGRRLTNWAAAKLDEGSRVTTTMLAFDAGPAIPPIRGFVRDSSGGVVAGATVKTRVATALTDAGGGFELRGLDPGMRHDITIEKAGYVTFTGSVEVPLAGRPAPPDQAFTLDRRSTASGKITRKGQPASGVKVVAVQRIDGEPGTPPMFIPSSPTTTDAAGVWRLSDLEAGNYVLKIGAEADKAFEPGGKPFTVQGGQNAEVGSVEAP